MTISVLLRKMLFLGALALAAVYLYVGGQLLLVRHAAAVKTFFESDEKIRLAFHRHDLAAGHFLFSRSEFEWQGQMVDVLERRTVGDSLIVIGYADRAETELKKLAPWLFEDDAPPPSGRDPKKKAKPGTDGWAGAFRAFRFRTYAARQPVGFPEPRPLFSVPLLDVPYPPPLG